MHKGFSLVLGLGLILTMGLGFDPSVYAFFHQPFFAWDRDYLHGFLTYPGGAIEALTQGVFQFFQWRWIGAVILGGVLGWFFYLANGMIHARKAPFPSLFAALPTLLLFALQLHYGTPFVVTMRALTVIVLVAFYRRLGFGFRVVMLFSAGLLYGLLGGLFYLLWISLCLLETLFSHARMQRVLLSLGWALVGLLVPYACYRLTGAITLREAYLYRVPYEAFYEPYVFRDPWLFRIFLVSLPLIWITAYLVGRFWPAPDEKTSRGRIHIHSPWPQALIVLLLVIVVFFLAWNPTEKRKIQIDILADTGRWDELLALSRKIQTYDRIINFQINRAMAHRGRLLDDLFTYEQRLGVDGLFLDRVLASQIAFYASELYFDLGHFNAARRLAYEAYTKFRTHPRILKRLALIHLIQGQPGAARKFLGLLSKSPIHHGWAADQLALLAKDPMAETLPLVREKRRLCLTQDFFVNPTAPSTDLIRILREHPENRLAFDYLMAYYLLEGRLGDLTRIWDQWAKPPSAPIPRHVEEALVLANHLVPNQVPLDRYAIAQTTRDRFSYFNMILSQFAGNESRARETLGQSFGDTFWYYVRFESPKVTKMKLRAERVDVPI